MPEESDAPERRTLRRPAFALATMLAVLITLEGMARLFMAGLEPTGFDDASWRNAWLREHAGRGEIFYAFDRFDPSKGWISQPGLRAQPAFAGKTLSTNSLGLRGAREIGDPGDGESPRIVVLGDSFTFGDEVGDDETYVHLLEQGLPGSRVSNFGVHGYGHDQMLILLREHGEAARPDLVLLGFVYADIHRNLLSFRDFAKPRFEFDGGRLVLRGMPLPTPREVLEASSFAPRIPDLFRVARGLVAARTGALDARARELTEHILDELLRETRRLGALPLFVYLPVEGEIQNTQRDPTARERYLLDYCRARDIACTSLRPRFAHAYAAGVELATLGHWGPAGHRIAAEGIAAFVSGLPSAMAAAESAPPSAALEESSREQPAITSSTIK